MSIGLIQSAAPTIEPVTLAEARVHLRIDNTSDDLLIERCITAARRFCEHWTQRQFITATWKLYLREFPSGEGEIVLPRPPIGSVTSIAYIDTNGATQTLAAGNYRVTAGRTPARIEPAYDCAWPGTRDVSEAVIVTYTAGYGATAASVPADLRAAILLMVTHLYEFRQPVIAGTITKAVELSVTSLLDTFRHGWTWDITEEDRA